MALVLVGMSGGVDSAVTAHLLIQEGHEVIGATMRLWTDDEHITGGCCALSAVEDARQVAALLDIPHYVLNYRDIFQHEVVDPFVEAYRAGTTPNPCIACNSSVRFTHFLGQARALGCDYIATGHYARIAHLPQGPRLGLAVDTGKDQTYMLFRMTEAELRATLFPLGGLHKSEVRAIAAKLHLPVANKPDSQDICFVPDNDYRAFLRRRGVTDEPGEIVDTAGRVLGRHAGVFDFTVGQRKGLGLTSKTPLYVLRIDVAANKVVVGEADDLLARHVMVDHLHLLDEPTPDVWLLGKTRYSTTSTPCRLEVLAVDKAVVHFAAGVRAPTPGQSLVLYRDGYVIGGGRISASTLA